MTEPIRLIESECDDFERALLLSATADRGSQAARVRCLAVFGGVGLHLATATSAAAVGTASGITTTAPKVTLLALVKWIGGGTVLGLVAASGLNALVEPRAPLPSVSQPTAQVVAARPTAAAPAVTAPASAPISAPVPKANAALLPAPSVATAEEVAPRASSATFPGDAGSSRLREELVVLERARAALRGGDATRALAELSSYGARFPSGALAREATLLAVEARLAAGDARGARAVAAGELATDPQSPHAQKLRALLDKEGER